MEKKEEYIVCHLTRQKCEVCLPSTWK